MSARAVSARTAVYALEDIALEIVRLGKPANPALERNLRSARACLDAGGTIFGYYGSGKTLLSLLYSLLNTARGEPTVVVEAYAVVRSTGRKRLRDLSPSFEALRLLRKKVDGRNVAEVLTGWLSRVVGEVDPRYLLEQLERLGGVSVELEGAGMEKLLKLIDEVGGKGISRVVLDEFERLVVNYEAYGYRTQAELLEDLFLLADRKEPFVGLSIPHTLRGMLDLEIIARMQPITQIVYEERELVQFFKNFMNVQAESMNVTPVVVERLVEEILHLGLRLRVPRAVISLALEAAQKKSIGEVALDRLKFLCLAAYSYPTTSLKRRACLYMLYAYAWISQNAYEPIDAPRLGKALQAIRPVAEKAPEHIGLPQRFREYLERLYEDPKTLVRAALRGGVIEKVGNLYMLSPRALENLVSAITGRLAELAVRTYGIGFEPKTLLVELQLQA